MTPAAGSSRAERTRRTTAWSRLHDLALGALVLFFLLGVPFLAGRSTGGEFHAQRSSVSRQRIDVNDAEWYEWTLLEEIGEARARAIVEYRRAHGPFRRVEDLAAVPGLPRGWVSRVREHLTIGAEEQHGEADR